VGGAVIDVLSLAAALGMLMAIYEYREARRMKAQAWKAVAEAAQWQQKYGQLLEDLKRKVGEPRVVVETREVPGMIKARSSAEVRRRFEEVNGRE
jgi:hypothetical protein